MLRFSLVALFLACSTLASAESDLRVAIVETEDEFTRVLGLSDFLDARGIEFDDLSDEFERGEVPRLEGVDLFIVGSFITADGEKRATYAKAGDALRGLVDRGSVVAVLGQADQHSSEETWMAAPRRITRTDPDFEVAHPTRREHPLVSGAGELSAAELRGWRTPTTWRGSNTLWETFGDWSEGAVLIGGDASKAPKAAGLIEMGWGDGRAVFYAMAPDKAFVAGNEPAKAGGAKLLDNLLAYGAIVKRGEAPEIKATPTGGYQHPIQGTVYRDLNANGERDAGEEGLAGIAVSDGRDVVLSDEAGQYRLPNEDKKSIFAFIHQTGAMKQNGQTYFARLANDAGAEARFDFPIVLAEKEAEEKDGAKKESVRFVQLTDSHVRSAGDRDYMIQATSEIYEMNPAPDFVVATGDLVDWGIDEHFKNYVAGMQKPPVPYFNVFGNHEIAMGPIERYHEYIGPDYFSFERGGIVFLSLNCVTPGARQDAWLKSVLELLAKGRPVVVFQHYPPSVEEMERFAGLGVKSVFSGHWHSEKEMEHGGVQSINSPTFIMGGIDASPAGFKIVELKKDGSAETEWRYGFQDKRLAIVSPQKGTPIDGSYFPVIVNAYDTSDGLAAVDWRLGAGGNPKAGGKLRRDSALSWTGRFGHSHRHGHPHDHHHGDAHDHDHDHEHSHPHDHEHGEGGEHDHPQEHSHEEHVHLPPGSYPFEVTARDGAGATWTKRQQVEIVEGAPAAPAPGREWTMFMGSGAHTGDVGDSIGELPLRLVWSVDTGGDPDFAAPIHGDGRIYLALKKRTRGRTNGVAAFDPVSGERIWLFETAMAVNHTPAYWEGVVCAAEMGGRTYGIDAERGEEIWHHDLIDARGRFSYCAPAIEDGWFYTGVMRRMAKLRAQDGKVAWERQIGADNDWISSYGSPAVEGDLFAMTGNFSRGAGTIVGKTSDGAEVWRHGDGMLASATFAGDRVLFATTQSVLHCRAKSDGAELWATALAEERGDANWSATTPAVRMTGEGEGIVVAGSGDGRMSGVDLASGKILWTHVSDETVFKVSPYRRDGRPLVSSATIAGDCVFFGSADGHLYCLDLATGEERWKYVIGVPVMSTPLITGNALYVTAYDGRLYAFTSGEANEDDQGGAARERLER